uniref:Neurotransmitter-gated ion-channel ligand-binding domain-containing protein n=1 Tax=Parascaris univalens TaxID=6257 RepID=A0A915B680_PARUN
CDTQSALRGDIKSTLVADHSKRTHVSGHFGHHDATITKILTAMEKDMQVEEELQSYTAEFARSTQSHRIFNSEDSLDLSNGNNAQRYNRFRTTKFDKNFKTHSLCESWNSGKQTDNLEWSESADRLLRIIGNGVVKNGYNMFMAPGQAQGKSTNVSVAVYIESMSSFKAQTMDFEVDMYLALGWYDRRLAHNCTHPILVAHKFIADRLWHPDLYFVNSKFAYLQEVTTPNFMVIVYPDGLIFKSMRIDVTLSCMMDLQRFPLDKQECPLVIQSYAYVENLLNLTWHE